MARKKVIVMALLGAFVLAGIFTPYITQASQHQGMRMGGPGAAVMAERMAQDFGLNKDDVVKYCQQGVNPRDLMHAAMIAKASGQSLDEIMAKKTLANTWQSVEQSVGVTKEQLRAQRQDMMAANLEKSVSIPKQQALELMNQGYHGRDIAMASVLAQESKKSVTDVLAMRKINNRWHDVAKELGISDEALKKDMQKLHPGMMGGKHGQMGGMHHGGQFGGPQMGEGQRDFQ